MQNKYFITTTIPYVNARPHIGHALEIVQADALSRYRRLRGSAVIFQTGTDENAGKNVQAAREQSVPVQEFVDRNSACFESLVDSLNAKADIFIRTSAERHKIGVEEFWNRIDSSLLYKRSYTGTYCQGCEEFLTERDLEDGVCPEHLVKPTEVTEENHFFRLSQFQSAIEDLIESDELLIVPVTRKQEVLAFVRRGLQDICVSRDASRAAAWGISVPGDPTQTIYVWIDALINYVTGSGFGTNDGWKRIWARETKKVHVIGKNVWKFHAVYWPAMLLAAELPFPDSIFVHGFLTADGVKMSKSLGNVVDPLDELSVWPDHPYAADAMRLYLLSLNPFADGDYSRKALEATYNRSIAGGIGSAVTRVTALCERFGVESVDIVDVREPDPNFAEAMDSFRFDNGLAHLHARIDRVNADIEAARPWEKNADRDQIPAKLESWVRVLYSVGYWLTPFVPDVGKAVCSVLSNRPVRKPAVLFERM